MSIINAFLRDLWSDPWKEMTGSSRLYDQDFGYVVSPEDIVMPRYWRHPMMVPRMQRPPQTSGMSEVVNDEKEFRMSLDVKHFKPEEINVKTRDNRVIIDAKHEERPDEHGFIMRQFTRQYILPKDVDPNAVTSTLSPDGMLIVKAPKKALPEAEERVIPIEHEATQKLEQ